MGNVCLGVTDNEVLLVEGMDSLCFLSHPKSEGYALLIFTGLE